MTGDTALTGAEPTGAEPTGTTPAGTTPTGTNDTTRRKPRVKSDARTHPRAEDRDDVEPVTEPAGDVEAADARERTARGAGGERTRNRPQLSLPLAPVLGVLLVLLLGAIGYLWLTRPEKSSVRADTYAEVLAQARSEVVDMTSFDYLTLDDDVEQIRRVTTGDLRKEAVDQLDGRRQELTDSQSVVNTEVVGAGVTRADENAATVLLVVQSTQQSKAGDQAQVRRYRIEATLTKENGRWLLSGITGR